MVERGGGTAGSGRSGGSGAWWNDESQSWETGSAAPGSGSGTGFGSGTGVGAGSGSGPLPELPPVAGFVPRPLPGTGQGAAEGFGPVVPLPPLPAFPPAYPPMDPAPGGAGPGGATGPSRHVLVTAVAAAVLVAGGLGGWLLWGRDGGDGGGTAQGPPAGPGTSTSVSDAPSASASDSPAGPASPSDPAADPASPSPSPVEDVPPSGFTMVEDESGFRLAVPAGWTRTVTGGSVFYVAPGGSSLIQIYDTGESGLTPYEALRKTSQSLSVNTRYEEISLEKKGGGDTAELVYAYDRDEGRRQVVARAFATDSGKPRIMLVAGPKSEWPRQQETLITALTYYRPTP
ncbi:hypothetical protein ABZ990_05750 [Streptomyces sp. NPDC046203]|uniref:hypothetical protein n=1 Tax=Streptomyces sp. NPDC046203 TaxID=3154602 RepID=UPI0033F73838